MEGWRNRGIYKKLIIKCGQFDLKIAQNHQNDEQFSTSNENHILDHSVDKQWKEIVSGHDGICGLALDLTNQSIQHSAAVE
jgi:hypothetical protein